MSRRVCDACAGDWGLWEDDELIEVYLDPREEPLIVCPQHRAPEWIERALRNVEARERSAVEEAARKASAEAIPTWKKRLRQRVEGLLAASFFASVLSLIGLVAWATLTAEPEPTTEERIVAAQTKRQAAADARRREAEKEVGFSEWTWIGQTCADGWSSPSIGEQGACSWHGGVVNVYENDAGGKMQCGEGWPPDPETAVEQLAEFGFIFCSNDPF